MIGFKFKIKNEYNIFLERIFQDIDSNKCKWVVNEQEVYAKNGNDVFTQLIYKNSDIKDLMKNMCYIVFLNLQLYKSDGNITEISNYEDFLNSDCILILFITDSEFVDVYSKDSFLFRQIYNNAVKNGFTEIELIDSNVNIRKTFSAYTD